MSFESPIPSPEQATYYVIGTGPALNLSTNLQFRVTFENYSPDQAELESAILAFVDSLNSLADVAIIHASKSYPTQELAFPTP